MYKKVLELVKTRGYGIVAQYAISIILIVLIATLCYSFLDFIGHRVVALILLLAVSVLAMLFDIFPVLLTALLSAIIWNFFFIPPRLNFHINTPEDVLMFLMYFVVAMINAVLTFRLREAEKKMINQEEKERTIQLYNTLLNSLSHELKTPISTIIGAIDTIKDNQTNLTSLSKDELYSEIEIASFRLNRQVKNLLSMSRLESGFLNLNSDWCDVNELIFSVLKNNQENAQNHTVIFNPNEELPLFKIDRTLVEQIIHNILHNALQHTPKGTVVKIEVVSIEKYCQFVITDNGFGFPEEKKDQVFDKFYRLDSNSTGGTGLGLSIAKGFTEALNGTICLENIKTGGAKFTVRIPSEILPINNLNHE